MSELGVLNNKKSTRQGRRDRGTTLPIALHADHEANRHVLAMLTHKAPEPCSPVPAIGSHLPRLSLHGLYRVLIPSKLFPIIGKALCMSSKRGSWKKTTKKATKGSFSIKTQDAGVPVYSPA
ncbi:MAG: hypothetical protein IJ083_08005 [Clostridia bacterium]|nr:hypothetical protein [Clostridia bacterium]